MIAALLPLLLSQQAAQSVAAVYDADLVLEYPSLIEEEVQGYYGCLKSGAYVVGGGQGFAAQYRQDIPRCARQAAQAESAANALLAARGRADVPPADVAAIFETVRRIHVARGQGLDRLAAQVDTRAAAYRAETYAPGDPNCLAAIQEQRAARDAYAAQYGPGVRAVYDKPDYTDDDRRIMASYERELGRMTAIIEGAQQRCPAARFSPGDAPRPQTAPAEGAAQ